MRRFQLDLTDEAKEALDALKKKAGKTSLRATVASALALYEAVLDHKQSGGSVIFKGANGKQETLKMI